MSKLNWDETGKHFYETGVDHGVLYLWDEDSEAYNNGYTWNGLTAVNETPSGAEETKLFADNIKYLSLRSAEEFGATVEAYTYPDEFGQCDGSADLYSGVKIGQQKRKVFGLSYRTVIGNDTDGNDKGYKLHLIYGCTASPSEKAYQTINDSPEAITFSWEVTTTPIAIKSADPSVKLDFKNTSIITIDSTKLTATADQAKLAALETILYGVDADPEHTPPIEAVDPKLPMPGEVYDLFNAAG